MSKPATKTVRYYILSAIGIAIMLFFKYIPPVGTVTELGMNVLGIFIGAIWWPWCCSAPQGCMKAE